MTSPDWPSLTMSWPPLGCGCRWRWNGPKGCWSSICRPAGTWSIRSHRGSRPAPGSANRTASSKDDVFDAFVLADTLRHEHAHWRPLPIRSPALAELRALTRDRDRLQATQQRTEAQLRAILEAYHPAA